MEMADLNILNIFKELKERDRKKKKKKLQPWLLYPEKILFKVYGEIKGLWRSRN